MNTILEMCFFTKLIVCIKSHTEGVGTVLEPNVNSAQLV